MSAAAIKLGSDWHRVGAGLSVRFSLTGDGGMDAEWVPRLPTRREFRRIERAYRTARDKFLQELAERRGATILCLELQT